MNKFLLGIGAALLIAAGGISLASTANAVPPISPSPTLRVKYELFGGDQQPMQSNTVVFIPVNGEYTPSPEIKYWLSQPSYARTGEEKYADLQYGIKFTLVPKKWDHHQTYVVNLKGVVGDGHFAGKKDADLTVDVTLNPGEQVTPLTKMFTLKTTIEEIGKAQL